MTVEMIGGPADGLVLENVTTAYVQFADGAVYRRVSEDRAEWVGFK